MCLINGDISGALFAAHEFSTLYTTHSDGSITKDYIPIYEIVREAVHQYAQEPYHNIIINDLDTCGVELLDYICDDAKLYIYDEYPDENVVMSTSGTSVQYDIYGQDIIPSTIIGSPSFNSIPSTDIRFETPNDILCKVFDEVCASNKVTYN
jgi:hypothetical protein